MPDAIRARYPQLPQARLTKLVAQALAAGLILESDGRYSVPTEPVGVAPDEQEPTPGRTGLRAVAIDLESLVRTVPTEPYLERRVYQAAAKRFGSDRT
ncbi:hypothetical protein [Streptomyces sp. NBC_01320]|uniref:hypothetical protein n=1 Tax=Streptomyces sp. NBC_01320 TaxID=2903824 RepID=UPI002E0E8874|nr:hypothetical protein OG395_14010 [Streptomyces sp. NBC_01320]